MLMRGLPVLTLVKLMSELPMVRNNSPSFVVVVVPFPSSLLTWTSFIASLGGTNRFNTDSGISSGRFGSERTLQKWVPDAPETQDTSLESTNNRSGTWDQFAENERLFGVKTNYDENFYTTAIDKSHPQYKERLAAAERKAREIERSIATTAHVAEERVMDFVGDGNDKGGDEEDKYDLHQGIT
jgi:PAB1-binding protein PBP1